MDLCETIDAVMPVLEEILRSSKNPKNEVEDSAHRSDLREAISKSIDECERRNGWVLLSDVGLRLSESGMRCTDKLRDMCLDMGFEIRSENSQGANPNNRIYFVR